MHQNAAKPNWIKYEIKKLSQLYQRKKSEGFYESARHDLHDYCQRSFKKGKHQTVYGPISAILDTLAEDIMTQGALAVLIGKENGWRDIQHGLAYEKWSARFRHGFMARDNCFDEARNPASAALFNGREALGLCLAIFLGDETYARGFGTHLLNTFERMEGGDNVYFYTTPFFPFALKLLSIWNGREIVLRTDLSNPFRTDMDNPLGRYRAVVDYWKSPSLLAGAIINVCDLHCEDVCDLRTSAISAFDFHPYNVFPVEIGAIIKVRESLGLETPELMHPLTSTPLLSPCPTAIADLIDQDMAKAIARFNKDGLSKDISW